MTVTELKTCLSLYEDPIPDFQTFDVRVVLSDPSIASERAAGIKSVKLGGDFHRNEFLLCPDEPIFRNIKRMDKPAEIVREVAGGMAFNACPSCRMRVASYDAYCRYCGQKLKYKEG